LEKQSEEASEPQHSLHLCIVNLVIGTLYCSKGNFDFGIRLIIKSLDPFSEKIGTDTWFYTKRCLLALIEKIVNGSYTLQESLYAHIIIFLDEAYQVGKQITTVLFANQQQ
jgi:tetratricopeptide repeat protein 30